MRFFGPVVSTFVALYLVFAVLLHERRAMQLVVDLPLVATAIAVLVAGWMPFRWLSQPFSSEPERLGLTLRKPLELTPEHARRLVEQGCNLDLGPTETISAEAAAEIAQNEGSLRLRNLKSISVEALEALAKHEGTLTLGARLRPITGGHSLFGSFTDAHFEALKGHRGSLALDGLINLTDKQAEILAEYKGLLCLNQVKTLTDAQAESLARHKRGLLLRGLTAVSDEQFKILGTNPRVRLPRK
jgi:hypothetical protein